MNTIDFSRPFPDYVTCPQCGEPEVEVWCYAVEAKCHNCGHTFEHALPIECGSICSDQLRAQAARIAFHPAKTCAEVVDHFLGAGA